MQLLNLHWQFCSESFVREGKEQEMNVSCLAAAAGLREKSGAPDDRDAPMRKPHVTDATRLCILALPRPGTALWSPRVFLLTTTVAHDHRRSNHHQ